MKFKQFIIRIQLKAALATVALTLLSPSFGIWNGIPTAAENSYPAVFYLALDSVYQGGVRGPHDCTGTLVHPRLILTAAHCLENDARFLYGVNGVSKRGLNQWIIDNDKTLPENGMVIKSSDVEKLVYNPRFTQRGLGYAGKISQDFGYILLKNPITTITPASVRSYSSEKDVELNLKNQKLDVIGFGYPDPSLDPRHKLYGLKLKGQKVASIANYDYIQTLRGNQAPLEGDSGGAAFLANSSTLVGIITGSTDGSTTEANHVSNYATLSSRTVCWIQKSSGVVFSNAACP